MTLDSVGNLYFTETAANVVRKVSVGSGSMTIIGGVYGSTGGSSGDGSAATDVSLKLPQQVSVSPEGFVFVADTGNNKVLVLRDQTDATPLPTSKQPNFLYEINTVAGICRNDGSMGFANLFTSSTVASATPLNIPMAVAVSPGSSDLYIADTGNCVIRKVSGGKISTVFGILGFCDLHDENIAASNNTGGSLSTQIYVQQLYDSNTN